MTVSSTNRKAGPYVGTGLVATYPFAFKVFQASDLLVAQATAAGALSYLQLITDYSVSLNADQNANPGGTISLNVHGQPSVPQPLASGTVLAISSQVAELQGTSIQNNSGFYPKVIETALDLATVLIQQLSVQQLYSVAFPLTDPMPPSVLPAAAVRAGRVLGFDASGNLTTFPPATPVFIPGADMIVFASKAAANAATTAQVGLGAAFILGSDGGQFALKPSTAPESTNGSCGINVHLADSAATGYILGRVFDGPLLPQWFLADTTGTNPADGPLDAMVATGYGYYAHTTGTLLVAANHNWNGAGMRFDSSESAVWKFAQGTLSGGQFVPPQITINGGDPKFRGGQGVGPLSSNQQYSVPYNGVASFFSTPTTSGTGWTFGIAGNIATLTPSAPAPPQAFTAKSAAIPLSATGYYTVEFGEGFLTGDFGSEVQILLFSDSAGTVPCTGNGGVYVPQGSFQWYDFINSPDPGGPTPSGAAKAQSMRIVIGAQSLANMANPTTNAVFDLSKVRIIQATNDLATLCGQIVAAQTVGGTGTTLTPIENFRYFNFTNCVGASMDGMKWSFAAVAPAGFTSCQKSTMSKCVSKFGFGGFGDFQTSESTFTDPEVDGGFFTNEATPVRSGMKHLRNHAINAANSDRLVVNNPTTRGVSWAVELVNNGSLAPNGLAYNTFASHQVTGGSIDAEYCGVSSSGGFGHKVAVDSIICRASRCLSLEVAGVNTNSVYTAKSVSAPLTGGYFSNGVAASNPLTNVKIVVDEITAPIGVSAIFQNTGGNIDSGLEIIVGHITSNNIQVFYNGVGALIKVGSYTRPNEAFGNSVFPYQVINAQQFGTESADSMRITGLEGPSASQYEISCVGFANPSIGYGKLRKGRFSAKAVSALIQLPTAVCAPKVHFNEIDASAGGGGGNGIQITGTPSAGSVLSIRGNVQNNQGNDMPYNATWPANLTLKNYLALIGAANVTFNGGNPITNGAQFTATITVPGCGPTGTGRGGGIAKPFFASPSLLNGCVLTGYISANDTVTVAVTNNTGSAQSITANSLCNVFVSSE